MFNQYRDGVVLAELDSKDHRIGNALTVIGYLLSRHPEVGDAIPTAGPQLRSIAQRVAERGIKGQDGVNPEQPDRPAGGGPFGDDPESQ